VAVFIIRAATCPSGHLSVHVGRPTFVKEYALSSSKLESEKRKEKQRGTLISACEKVLKAYERMTTGIDLGADAA
jgi:hypothetical protein